MTKPVTALHFPPLEALSDETRAYFDKCEEKLGLVPNVLRAYAFDENKLRAFTQMYNDLMLSDSGLSKLEREMIAVAVSSINTASTASPPTAQPCASSPATRCWVNSW